MAKCKHTGLFTGFFINCGICHSNTFLTFLDEYKAHDIIQEQGFFYINNEVGYICKECERGLDWSLNNSQILESVRKGG